MGLGDVKFMNYYLDLFDEKIVKEKDYFAPPERYIELFIDMPDGVNKLVYQLKSNLLLRIDIAYTDKEETLGSMGLILEARLRQHGLKMDDIIQPPVAWHMSKKKMKNIQKEYGGIVK